MQSRLPLLKAVLPYSYDTGLVPILCDSIRISQWRRKHFCFLGSRSIHLLQHESPKTLQPCPTPFSQDTRHQASNTTSSRPNLSKKISNPHKLIFTMNTDWDENWFFIQTMTDWIHGEFSEHKMPRGNLGLPSVTTPTGAAMLHLLPVAKSLLMSSRCHFARPELKHCKGAEPNSHGN